MLKQLLNSIPADAPLTVITTQGTYSEGEALSLRLQEAAARAGVNDLSCLWANEDDLIEAFAAASDGFRKVLICDARFLGLVHRASPEKPAVLPLIALGASRRQDLQSLRRALDVLGLACVGVICDYSHTRALRFELERFLDTYCRWLPGRSWLRARVASVPFMSYDVIEDLAVEVIPPVAA